MIINIENNTAEDYLNLIFRLIIRANKFGMLYLDIMILGRGYVYGTYLIYYFLNYCSSSFFVDSLTYLVINSLTSLATSNCSYKFTMDGENYVISKENSYIDVDCARLYLFKSVNLTDYIDSRPFLYIKKYLKYICGEDDREYVLDLIKKTKERNRSNLDSSCSLYYEYENGSCGFKKIDKPLLLNDKFLKYILSDSVNGFDESENDSSNINANK